MKLYLYGAGNRGKGYLEILNKNGISVSGFIDSKAKLLESVNGVKCIEYSDFLDIHEDKQVVISVATDNSSLGDIRNRLQNDHINLITLTELLSFQSGTVENGRNLVADFHLSSMDDYYKKAEESVNLFWDEGTVFRSFFDKLDLNNVVELACGKGRHTSMYCDRAGTVTIVDILDKNISDCRIRFADKKNIVYYVNNGYDLHEIETDSQTSLFSYDSVVHFELMDVYSYLVEIKRILQRNGLALIHHSNNHYDYRLTFETGEHGRNYMSAELFAYLANRAGLEIVEQKIIDWGGISELDCISLLRKNN